MQRISYLMIVLSFFSSLMFAMKRDAIEVEENWGYKKRKNNCLVQCCLPESNKEYPYFLPEKEDKNAKRSFLDELRIMHCLVEKKIFPKEITEIILRYSYQLFIDAHQKFASKLKVHDQFAPKLEGWSEWDTFYLNKTQKQTILFLKKYRSFEIDGLDKHFAQKMTHNIVHLPHVTKQKLVPEYGNNIICNTLYEASLRNTILGENDDNKRCCAKGGMGISCGCSLFTALTSGVIVAKVKDVFIPSLKAAAFESLCALCIWLGMMLITDSGFGVYSKIRNRLMESLPEKRQRLGIQTIPLLQEMECAIIDQ
ncbi:MAG TPA: hypothetical protein VKU36_02860 [Candidatus Babeliales bacterium]|nr:hypothetical protein [Candidatus Babeliales bacterium]